MYRILILEDSPVRIKIFKDKFKHEDVYFFDQVSDTIFALDNMGPWDMVFLDHDLDGQMFVPSHEPNTGWQVARHIAEKQIPIHAIFIHSMNDDGAQNMLELLPHADRVRFPNLMRLI